MCSAATTSAASPCAWVIFVVILPWLGVLIYLIAEHDGMRKRSIEQAQAQKQAFDPSMRDAAGGPAGEIAQAKELLDSGAITQAEFDGDRREGGGLASPEAEEAPGARRA